MTDFGPHPGLDSDGDYDAAEDLWQDANLGGEWVLEAWHKSPLQMQTEARAVNHAMYAHVAANAGKHSNPPVHSWERDT